MVDKQLILEKGGYRAASSAPVSPPTTISINNGYRPSSAAPANPPTSAPAVPATGQGSGGQQKANS